MIMTPCNDDSGKYCCGEDTSCCGTSRAIELPAFLSPTGSSSGGVENNESQSKAWVAGPVVGSVAAVCILGLVVVWYYKRHKKPKNTANSQPGNDAENKPQLHSDCIPKRLPAEVETTERYELFAESPGLFPHPSELGVGSDKTQGAMKGSRSELADPQYPPELGNEQGGNNKTQCSRSPAPVE